MSEYWDRHLDEIGEETRRRCSEARQEADWWASEHPNATPKEVVDEAGSRYMSFYERAAFEKEARDVIELIEQKKNK